MEMKTYNLFPILSCVGSVTVGSYHGYLDRFVEDQFLCTVGAGMLVVGGSIVAYFHSKPQDAPHSWNGDIQHYARFGVLVGGVLSAGAYGVGYALGRGCAFGLEQLL